MLLISHLAALARNAFPMATGFRPVEAEVETDEEEGPVMDVDMMELAVRCRLRPFTRWKNKIWEIDVSAWFYVVHTCGACS